MHLHPALLFLCSLVLLSSSCRLLPEPKADPTRYYTLSAPASSETGLTKTTAGLRLGLRNIEVPAYLRKGLVVVRTGDHEVHYDDYARWAEPLDQAIARLVQTGLLTQPQVGRVSLSPLPLDEERDFEIQLRVRQAEGYRDGNRSRVNLVLAVEVWSAGAAPELLHQQLFSAARAPWDGRNHAEIARQLSEGLLALAKELAENLPPKTAAKENPAKT